MLAYTLNRSHYVFTNLYIFLARLACGTLTFSDQRKPTYILYRHSMGYRMTISIDEGPVTRTFMENIDVHHMICTSNCSLMKG
jgi:hypothetical protein